MNIINIFEIIIFFYSEHHKEKRRKRANTWYKSSEEVGNGPDKQTCRTRYQQTPVEVYARFIAVDQVIDWQFTFSKRSFIFYRFV